MRRKKQRTALPLVWEHLTRPAVLGYVDDRQKLAELRTDRFAEGARVFVRSDRRVWKLRRTPAHDAIAHEDDVVVFAVEAGRDHAGWVQTEEQR